MKILVTGADGMLGSMLVSTLQKAGVVVVGASRKVLDITDAGAVERVIAAERPSHVVNCAAYTHVDQCEVERSVASAVNATGVQHLLSACEKKHCKLVQVSTDYVFGVGKSAHAEYDQRAPLNYYGETKAAAEAYLEASAVDYQIIRTAWLFGPNGKNFVDTVRRKLLAGESLRVVSDQIGSPTYTVDLALAIESLLDHPPGVYHVTNSGSCSWYALACAIAAYYGRRDQVVACTSADYPTRAARPSYSVLARTHGPQLRSWEVALESYLTVQPESV